MEFPVPFLLPHPSPKTLSQIPVQKPSPKSQSHIFRTSCMYTVQVYSVFQTKCTIPACIYIVYAYTYNICNIFNTYYMKTSFVVLSLWELRPDRPTDHPTNKRTQGSQGRYASIMHLFINCYSLIYLTLAINLFLSISFEFPLLIVHVTSLVSACWLVRGRMVEKLRKYVPNFRFPR